MESNWPGSQKSIGSSPCIMKRTNGQPIAAKVEAGRHVMQSKHGAHIQIRISYDLKKAIRRW